ncbi:MAG: hypothetical protein WA941_17255 [Nitrososphaeraceae archaeon]
MKYQYNKSQQQGKIKYFAITLVTSLAVMALVSVLIHQQIVLATTTTTTDKLPRPFSGGQLPVTNFTATNTYIVSGQTPEGGVDAFSYDGSGHVKLKSGTIYVDVDPITQTGVINATWVDNENNNWSFVQTQLMSGPMTGELYFEGVLPNGTAKIRLGNDSIAVNHLEHGNTMAGPPVLPTQFTYLGTWGPGELWKNGESLGMFGGHMMLTDGVRDPISGKVFSANKTSVYNPMNPADGYSNPNAAQVHLIIQSPMGPMTNNFPPQFETTYHLMFYDIKLR